MQNDIYDVRIEFGGELGNGIIILQRKKDNDVLH